MLTQNPYIVPLSREVVIGTVKMGKDHPLVIQSMANTPTHNVGESLEQCLRIIEAGGEMVRFTTQGKREVNSLARIKKELADKSITISLVADVHFNPAVAEEAAGVCDKVRINPGNFAEKLKQHFDPDNPAALEAARTENREQFLALIRTCKLTQTAIRVGVNHGSLSRRIMATHGNTPEGMAESALEFLRICHQEEFHRVVVSLKSSNTRVMVQAVRLLSWHMIHEDLYYPLHLGVTEAGDGIEGRIRSVTGIAPLLMEGMGDTIRVSLTETPEKEIPVAQQIRTMFPRPGALTYHPYKNLPWNPFRYEKPVTRSCLGFGGNQSPRVLSTLQTENTGSNDADYQVTKIERAEIIHKDAQEKEILPWNPATSEKFENQYVRVDQSTDPDQLEPLESAVLIYRTTENEPFTDVKAWLVRYYRKKQTKPVVVARKYTQKDQVQFALKAAGEFALLLLDGLIDGIWIENPQLPVNTVVKTSFQILQSSRARITQTEYIACPSCGRTLFQIEDVLAEVRKATRHLKGLKIAVMGCIVNGPGEMADADYGYVGAGKGKVSLYKGKTVQKKQVPQEEAVKELIALIRENGDWVDP